MGACSGCLLRIQVCRDTSRYLEGAPPTNCAEEETADLCGLCLGLLERGAAVLRQQFRKQWQEAAFEGSTYEMSISVPLLCIVRQQVLLCNLRALLCSAGQAGAEPDCVGLKDVLLWVLSEELHNLGLKVAQQSSSDCIRVAVVCEFKGAVGSVLERLQQSGGSRSVGSKRRRVEVPPQLSEKSVVAALQDLKPKALLAALDAQTLDQHLRRAIGSATTSVNISRASIFFRGRYLKLSREVPQSLWVIDGERKGESSVEEIIVGSIDQSFSTAEKGAFHAEGREDIDVRMLGGGRPFVVEVKSARLLSPSRAVEDAINKDARGVVVVRRLARCEASAMAALQRDAENHRKTYVCVCWSERPLSAQDFQVLESIRDVEVQQKTPLRVLHRRSLAIRPRTLHWLKAERINAHYFQARLSTQAGMYIKEFVHGDLGRTRPSLKSLLRSHVEILQLDVEGLEDETDGENELRLQDVADGHADNDQLTTKPVDSSARVREDADATAAV